MLPSTTDRVSANTCEEVNERIRRQTEANVARGLGTPPFLNGYESSTRNGILSVPSKQWRPR